VLVVSRALRRWGVGFVIAVAQAASRSFLALH
jgi:hypothetical protein